MSEIQVKAYTLAGSLLDFNIKNAFTIPAIEVAYGLQDTVTMQACGMTQKVYTENQRLYLMFLSEALMSLCLERFGPYSVSN
jgi:hypothetical protein